VVDAIVASQLTGWTLL